MICLLSRPCTLKRMNKNPGGKISGKVSLLSDCEGDTITTSYAARFEDLAAEKVLKLLPGAVFKVVDGELVEFPSRSKGTMSCLIIRDLELIKASGTHSSKSND